MQIIKVLLTVMLTILLFMTVTCSELSDAEAVAQGKGVLEVIFEAGDNYSSVTKDVGLTTSGENGTSISWVTGDSNIVSISGVVYHPENGSGDTTCTLTATISRGTASDVKVFILTVKEKTAPVTDIDGNKYQTVRIGNQLWTMENLRTTKFNDGVLIPQVPDSAAWAALAAPGYCYYNNTTNPDSIRKFGSLYNWYAVDTKKLAPAGWHVPSDSEWTILENYLVDNRYNWDRSAKGNKIAKSMAARTDWTQFDYSGAVGNDLAKNNRSGFSALPGGYRFSFGNFLNFLAKSTILDASGGHWWSATAADSDTSLAYYRHFYSYNEALIIANTNKGCGFSVRLLKDN